MANIRDKLYELAGKLESSLAKSFKNSIRKITDNAVISDIEKAINNNDVNGVIKAAGYDPSAFAEYDDEFRAAFIKLGNNETTTINDRVKTPRFKIWFDSKNPMAEDFARNQSSALVTRVDLDARGNIRETLANGISTGRDTRKIAYDLVGRINRATGHREGGVIGLTESQASWSINFAGYIGDTDKVSLSKALGMRLRDKRYDHYIIEAMETGRPIPASIRSKMILSYRNNSLLYRANTIARTEIGRARGDARAQAWQQAIDRGKVDERGIRRFWVTRKDERVRFDHHLIPPMNKNGVTWNEPFNTPSGASMRAPHDHDINCRCRERIVYRKPK